MSSKDSRTEKRKEILYQALVQSYIENAFFGMIKTIDNALVEILRFSLAILTAESLIPTLARTGLISTPVLVLFLTSSSAFLISSLIALYGYTQHTASEIDWFEEVTVISQKMRDSLEGLYAAKRRKQKIALAIFILGVLLLLTSIVTVIYGLRTL